MVLGAAHIQPSVKLQRWRPEEFSVPDDQPRAALAQHLVRRAPEAITDRRGAVLVAVRDEGLLGPKDKTIAGRLPSALIEAAKARSGIRSDSELLYALSRVALEDEYGSKLLARKGKIPRALTLDV